MRLSLLLIALSLAGASTRAQSRNEVLGLYPEFERCEALVLGFGELIQHHPKTLVDIVTALDGKIPIVGVVGDHVQYTDVIQSFARHPPTPLAIEAIPTATARSRCSFAHW